MKPRDKIRKFKPKRGRRRKPTPRVIVSCCFGSFGGTSVRYLRVINGGTQHDWVSQKERAHRFTSKIDARRWLRINRLTGMSPTLKLEDVR